MLLYHLAAAQITRERATDPDDVLPDGLVEEHRVESDHPFDDRRGKLESLRDVVDDFRAEPAVLTLAEPQDGQERRSTLGISSQDLVDLLFTVRRKGECHGRARGR